MSKSRVYELAKQYNTTSKMIMEMLSRNNITTKNHMSSVDAEGQKVLVRVFSSKPKEVSQQKISTKSLEQKEVKNKDVSQEVNKKQSQDSRDKSNSREGAQSSFKARDKVVGQRSEHRHGEQQPSRDRQEFQKRPAGNQQYNRPQGKPAFGQQSSAGQANQRGARPQFGQDRRPFNSNQQNQQRQGGQDTQQPRGQWQNRPNQGQGQQNRFNQNQNRFGQKPATGNFERKDNRVGSSSPGLQSSARTGAFSGGTSQGKPSAKRGDYQQNSNKPGQGRQNPKTSQLKKEDWNMGKNSRSETGRMRQRQQSKNQKPGPIQKAEIQKPASIQLGESIIVKDLAVKLGREVGEVIKKLMLLGIMATINQEVDFDTASLIAAEFEVEVTELPKEEDPTEIEEIEDDEKDLVHRSPVVTVMGHVDHGKTSLLDAIRQTNVISQEAGGITQHIGAYQVMCNNKKIVFLDTPGHEAFTAMRARGAQVTDIAILVVAADDGVMPQTIEAINHAKSAKVPIIVAINKMDREGANPDRVKQQLSENGLIPEDWGGDTVMVPVSAHQRTGINDLLEMVLLVAEMLDLKANPSRRAYGTVIEAKLDKNRGPVTTLLVQKGTLRVGDPVIAGAVFGRVRAMVNDRGEKIKKAEPSTPVEILGLTEVPLAGDVVASVDEKVARAVSEKRTIKKRTDELRQSHKVSLDDLFKQIQEGSIKDLNIVLKADVQGSIEALKQSLEGIKNSEVRVNIVHAGVGAINESDVMLATASNAFIIGYNVRPDANSRKAAENEKIDIRTYRVIYEAINDVEAAITGMLSPEYKEVLYGQAEIRQLISVPKTVVAGCYVTEGKITSNSQMRVIRNGIVVHEGSIESLRRFKDDVKEVNQGYECGISLENYRDIKEGDILESFGMEEIKKKIG